MTVPTKRRRSKAERIRPMYFETRLAPVACRKCRRALLIGTVKGELRKLDRTRLSVLGEYAALLDGMRTFQTNWSGSNLFPRRPFHINQGLPPFGRIHAEHHCGWEWKLEHFDLRDLYEQNDDGSGECPF